MAGITERESGKIEAANTSGKTPVVFIHGLWLLASSWEPWAACVRGGGLCWSTPGWPDDPATVEEARRDPQAFARKGVAEVADHFADAIERARTQAGARRPLFRRPDRPDPRRPGPRRGDGGGRPGALPRRPGAAARGDPIDEPVSRNPANRGRAVTLSFDQFRYSWANGLERGMRRGPSTSASTSPPRAGRSSRRRSRT